LTHVASRLAALPARGVWAWDVTAPEQIDKYSLARVLDAANSIDTLIIGTGAGMWLPPAELRAALRAVRVVVDAMQTGPAIRTYNIMMGERRRVAAALIAVHEWCRERRGRQQGFGRVLRRRRARP